MLYFEEARSELDIELCILLKKPQHDGSVERGNRTFREKFYAREGMVVDSVGAINSAS